MQKINTILLVDDDPATNFFHSIIIDDSKIAHRVEVAQNGYEALQFLSCEGLFESRRSPIEGCVPPDLIFLDINMPLMNGFEFLENWEKTASDDLKTRVKIWILTSSAHDQDQRRAAAFPTVMGYLTKPLSEESLETVVRQV